LRGDRVAVIAVPKLLRGDRVAVGCALSVLCIVFYNYFIQFFSNFEPQATLQIVVQAFELLAAALESSFKRLNFDVPMPRGVTAPSRPFF
jgi:hypothetical protein